MLPAVLSCLACSCVQDGTDDEDDAGEAFLVDGKSDAFGITESSPEASGVLALVNEASATTLDDEVGLSLRAVKRLIAHRDGGDGIAGTHDDDPFDTLVELDQVPYIGNASFGRLLDYARANGYIVIDAFDEASCSGPSITLPELQDLTAHGTAATLPEGVMWTRGRRCAGVLGCEPWRPGQVSGQSASEASSVALYQARPDGTIGVTIHHLLTWYAERSNELPTDARYELQGILEPRSAGTTIRDVRGTYNLNTVPSHQSTLKVLELVTMTMTDHCLRVSAFMPPAEGEAVHTRQIVYLSRF